ncbi:hypothetical protein GGR42_001815 [Saonia flava]|uniref:Uncharacterized protein n=1 Tax=Saonia flava TaxID=523696 RepID=A0A846QYR7_9FLAO|nr:hypothetical protein [Saonia flava]
MIILNTIHEKRTESEEIDKIIKNHDYFLKGLMLFTSAQFLMLVTYYTL